MAKFCRQCGIKYFGHNTRQFEGITPAEMWNEGRANTVHCSGCGLTQVDPEGNCCSMECQEKHANR